MSQRHHHDGEDELKLSAVNDAPKGQVEVPDEVRPPRLYSPAGARLIVGRVGVFPLLWDDIANDPRPTLFVRPSSRQFHLVPLKVAPVEVSDPSLR